MEWVASTLHTTLERGVSSITTADAHTSAASSRLNWRHRRFKWTRPFRRKTKSGFYACATFQTQSTGYWHCAQAYCRVHGSAYSPSQRNKALRVSLITTYVHFLRGFKPKVFVSEANAVHYKRLLAAFACVWVCAIVCQPVWTTTQIRATDCSPKFSQIKMRFLKKKNIGRTNVTL